MSTAKIGHIIGNWLVKSETFKEEGKFWNECECICGTKRKVATWWLTHNKTRGCGCTNTKGRFKFKGIGNLSLSYYNSFKQKRIKKGIEFSDNVTIEYLWKMFEEQKGKCKLTGLDIILDPKWSSVSKIIDQPNVQTASIDRIENSLGYIEGNIQWVHKDVNYMRGGMSIEDFVFLCHKVSSNIEDLREENIFIGKRRYFSGK